MSTYTRMGTICATAIVSLEPDRSGNFVADGTADNVEIDAAITYVNAMGGGLVHLCECPLGVTHYDIVASVTMLDMVWLEGEGWNTVLRATNGLDAAVILTAASATEHEGICIKNLAIDGNRANQSEPNALHPGGIHLIDCNDFKVLNVHIHDVRQFGLWAYFTSGTPVGGEIGGCLFEDCDWNAIQIGTSAADYHSYEVQIHDCKIDGFSDMGIALFGHRNRVENCVVKNGFGTNGAVNSGYGYGCEGYAAYNSFNNCLAYDCRAGIAYIENSHHNKFSDGHVINEGTGVGEWNGQALIMSDYNEISDTAFIDLAGQANDSGVNIRGGSYNTIRDCYFENHDFAGVNLESDANENNIIGCDFNSVNMGVYLDAATEDNNFIHGNDFGGCTTDVSDGGTGTKWGGNVKDDGTVSTWKEDLDP